MAENKKNVIQFTRSQFIGLLLGALVSGAVGGVFGAIRTLNSDHFTLTALAGKVSGIEEDLVPRKELETNFTLIYGSLNRIEGKLDSAIANRTISHQPSPTPTTISPATNQGGSSSSQVVLTQSPQESKKKDETPSPTENPGNGDEIVSLLDQITALLP